uniref:Uncharacterized protein n=1 Tax=Oryza sativa subsp. japonica TaxID=39947 RepID=Q8H4F4_ORYSJ|nr:hypothetical protein [Oryza sativa Japonica Group]
MDEQRRTATNATPRRHRVTAGVPGKGTEACGGALGRGGGILGRGDQEGGDAPGLAARRRPRLREEAAEDGPCDGEMSPDIELDATARSSHGGRAPPIGGGTKQGREEARGVGFIETEWERQGRFEVAAVFSALGWCSWAPRERATARMQRVVEAVDRVVEIEPRAREDWRGASGCGQGGGGEALQRRQRLCLLNKKPRSGGRELATREGKKRKEEEEERELCSFRFGRKGMRASRASRFWMHAAWGAGPGRMTPATTAKGRGRFEGKRGHGGRRGRRRPRVAMAAPRVQGGSKGGVKEGLQKREFWYSWDGFIFGGTKDYFRGFQKGKIIIQKWNKGDSGRMPWIDR